MNDPILQCVQENIDRSWKYFSKKFHKDVHRYVKKYAPELIDRHNALAEAHSRETVAKYDAVIQEASESGASLLTVCRAHGVSYRAVTSHKRRVRRTDAEVGDGKHHCLKCGKAIDSSLWFCATCKEANDELRRTHNLSGDLLYWKGDFE